VSTQNWSTSILYTKEFLIGRAFFVLLYCSRDAQGWVIMEVPIIDESIEGRLFIR
jgi:hypothetical protein